MLSYYNLLHSFRPAAENYSDEIGNDGTAACGGPLYDIEFTPAEFSKVTFTFVDRLARASPVASIFFLSANGDVSRRHGGNVFPFPLHVCDSAIEIIFPQ